MSRKLAADPFEPTPAEILCFSFPYVQLKRRHMLYWEGSDNKTGHRLASAALPFEVLLTPAEANQVAGNIV